jgi:DNA-binding SARP family transcriptional activator
MITFKLLGPLEVRLDDRVCTPSASKVRQVLAMTLFRSGQIVSMGTLIEELWADRPPRSAVTTVQTYIYQLRKLFARYGAGGAATPALRTVPPGYVLCVRGDQVDCLQFDANVARAEALLADGQDQRAAVLLNEALAMWNGRVLPDTDHGVHLRAHVAGLEEKQMLALELRLRADMRLGRHRQLVAELKSLVLAHPYHEWLHAQLMIALHRSGRRADALDAYHNARRVLNEELGLEPSADLQRIHQTVLQAEALSGAFDAW